MNQRDYEKAIEREVEEWPGVTVEFKAGGKHPKACLTYALDGRDPVILSRPFAGTPSDGAFGVHSMLGDMRRAMKQLGATRTKPTPSRDEDEAPYRKPNDGAEKRPDPVAHEKAAPKATVAEQMVRQGVAPTGLFERMSEPQTLPPMADPEERDAATRLAELLRTTCGLEIFLVGAVLAAVIAEAADLIEDGVYFGLPAEVYHAVPRLSASGIQRLCVSPATFWKGSWLDPERPELDEEETKAQMLGKAYHVARLEPERFHQAYVREIGKDDFPAEGFLSSDEKVKAELKARGEQQTVTGETTAERAERLLDSGYEGTIFPLEKARWQLTVQGRNPLPARYFDQIATDMGRIRDHGDIAPLLQGGEAEVSIFWTDRHGLKMKARPDYLTTAWWNDFKTFDNSRGKELEGAIVDAVRYNRYYVQATVYRDAIEAVRVGGLQVLGNATDAQRALVASIQIRPEELACWYIFQEKNGVPNLLARQFVFTSAGPVRDSEIAIMVDDPDEQERVRAMMASATLLHRKGLYEVDQAKRAFALYSKVYSPGDPWFPINSVAQLDEWSFNQHWLESRS